jgi:hypothetical protein
MLPSPTQIANSVISHAPKDSIGPLFVDIVRGPILPPRGTKERDWQLRIWDQADFNSMWQGARSGLVKKIAHIPFEIKGPPSKVQYYQDLLGYAHFSQGYEYLIEMWGRDYLTQAYGGIFEIAGPGDPTTQLLDPPTGINHLDAGRCYVTGNPTYPILYYSLWDGKLHKMHASRVYMIVDDPIPDERYFGLGTSALERAISINQREVRMNQYVDMRLDDMPQPGLLALSGASRAQWDIWVSAYQRDTSSDRLGPFGRTIVVTSVDPNAGVTAESIPFAQTPEKFDMVAYKSLDVDEICLAIGIDRQEIWELAGRGLGSSNQSQVMAEKAKGKTTGTMISGIERFMNWAILPDDCEFEIKAKDNAEQTNNAVINLQYARTAQALTAAGFTKQEVAKVMIEGSQTYKDAFTDDKGNLTVTSEDPGIPPQLPTLAPVPTVPVQPNSSNIIGQGDTPLAEKPQQGSPAPRMAAKAFSITRLDFENHFASILSRAVKGGARPNQIENLMLGLLQSSGLKAFADGLREGGVNDAPDDSDLREIQNIIADSIDYLDPLLQAAFDGTITPGDVRSRAEMWATKTLSQFYNAGRISSDRNGMYQWVLNPSCQHCDGSHGGIPCPRLAGQVHRFRDWYSRDILPGSDRLDCKGFSCGCRLIKTSEPVGGRF